MSGAPKFSRLDDPNLFSQTSTTLTLPEVGPPIDAPEIGFLYREGDPQQFRLHGVHGGRGSPRIYYYVCHGSKTTIQHDNALPLADGEHVVLPGRGVYIARLHGYTRGTYW